MINEQNLFNQPIKHKLITYDSIQKTETCEGDVYTTVSVLDYNNLKTFIS